MEKLRGVTSLAVLGVGSTLRADDAAGIEVVEKLKENYGCTIPRVQFYIGETAPENFSGKIASFNPTHLLIIDACDVGQAPGSFIDINPADVGGPTFSSHMLPIKVMVSYLVSETGMDVTLLGIQYKNIAFDTAMSQEVEKAVDEVYDALRQAIDTLLR
jgi:hydrogenase 3 maturation protease